MNKTHEKCFSRFENKEMLCKKGCRCEQQYGLHRLLAFDPDNECRGIFSDWFKFPSLCICKCYNQPNNWYEDMNETEPISEKEEVKRTTKKLRFPELNGAEFNIKSIPAYLPYEAKQALLHQLKQNKAKSTSQQHFLYGNAPIMGYKLADESAGSVEKAPR